MATIHNDTFSGTIDSNTVITSNALTQAEYEIVLPTIEAGETLGIELVSATNYHAALPFFKVTEYDFATFSFVPTVAASEGQKIYLRYEIDGVIATATHLGNYPKYNNADRVATRLLSQGISNLAHEGYFKTYPIAGIRGSNILGTGEAVTIKPLRDDANLKFLFTPTNTVRTHLTVVDFVKQQFGKEIELDTQRKLTISYPVDTATDDVVKPLGDLYRNTLKLVVFSDRIQLVVDNKVILEKELDTKLYKLKLTNTFKSSKKILTTVRGLRGVNYCTPMVECLPYYNDWVQYDNGQVIQKDSYAPKKPTVATNKVVMSNQLNLKSKYELVLPSVLDTTFNDLKFFTKKDFNKDTLLHDVLSEEIFLTFERNTNHNEIVIRANSQEYSYGAGADLRNKKIILAVTTEGIQVNFENITIGNFVHTHNATDVSLVFGYYNNCLNLIKKLPTIAKNNYCNDPKIIKHRSDLNEMWLTNTFVYAEGNISTSNSNLSHTEAIGHARLNTRSVANAKQTAPLATTANISNFSRNILENNTRYYIPLSHFNTFDLGIYLGHWFGGSKIGDIYQKLENGDVIREATEARFDDIIAGKTNQHQYKTQIVYIRSDDYRYRNSSGSKVYVDAPINQFLGKTLVVEYHDKYKLTYYVEGAIPKTTLDLFANKDRNYVSAIDGKLNAFGSTHESLTKIAWTIPPSLMVRYFFDLDISKPIPDDLLRRVIRKERM